MDLYLKIVCDVFDDSKLFTQKPKDISVCPDEKTLSGLFISNLVSFDTLIALLIIPLILLTVPLIKVKSLPLPLLSKPILASSSNLYHAIRSFSWSLYPG